MNIKAFRFGQILGLILFSFLPGLTYAQTVNLTQTAAGQNCHVIGCINAPLSDGETFTFSDTLKYYGSYPINGRLAFRGLNYYLSGHSSGYEIIDLNSAAYENNGFAVHEDFGVNRGGNFWLNGYLQLNKEYVGSDPFLYGWNGAINITNGTGQVGLAAATPYDQTITLVSSDSTKLQVPASTTILNGSLDANFTITATAPQGTVQVFTVTVTATFPDQTISTMTLTVGGVPASPPPDSKLFYPCGSKKADCLSRQGN